MQYYITVSSTKGVSNCICKIKAEHWPSKTSVCLIFNNNIKKIIYKPFILFVTIVLDQIWNFNNGRESFIETPNFLKGFIAASTSQIAQMKYRINLNMS